MADSPSSSVTFAVHRTSLPGIAPTFARSIVDPVPMMEPLMDHSKEGVRDSSGSLTVTEQVRILSL